jgi:hypothetical protein
MKLSKEERAFLSETIQQGFAQVWAANRAGKNKGKNKVEARPVAKAASAAE